MKANFNHFPLRLVEPSFSSNLTDLIIELDYLRRKKLTGTTHPAIFFQLKHLFHTLESIGSARIEGNRTTIAEYIETKIDSKTSVTQDIAEIQNMEAVMSYIDSNIHDIGINRAFISDLHKMTVKGLFPPPDGEGDHTPGLYRQKNISITGANHKPPDYLMVEDFMNEFFSFLSASDPPKYDLLKIAVAHHRFMWIHPFSNGNGRSGRLLTYALLVKSGFQVDVGRIINPTAIFCSDRNKYYENLAFADVGDDNGILKWCEYVLSGLKNEIEKIDKLLDYDYLKKEILYPAIGLSLESKIITDIEAKVLKTASDKQVIQAADIKSFFPGKASSEITRAINKLKDKKLLKVEKEGTRKYIICFSNNYLLRGIIKTLGDKGFLPVKD
jgi:Fic family protein